MAGPYRDPDDRVILPPVLETQQQRLWFITPVFCYKSDSAVLHMYAHSERQIPHNFDCHWAQPASPAQCPYF